jgi:hypothetical protein
MSRRTPGPGDPSRVSIYQWRLLSLLDDRPGAWWPADFAVRVAFPGRTAIWRRTILASLKAQRMVDLHQPRDRRGWLGRLSIRITEHGSYALGDTRARRYLTAHPRDTRREGNSGHTG